MISVTMGRGITCASYKASGFPGSRRNANDTEGSTEIGGPSDSGLSRFVGCDKSSAAGLFREISSPSNIIPLTWDVRRYWSIRFDNGPAEFVLQCKSAYNSNT